MIWHSQNIDTVLSELKADPEKGLTSEEAKQRLREYGKNETAKQESNPLSIFMSYIFSKTSIVLLVLTVVWLIVSAIWKTSPIEPIALFSFVILRGIIFGAFAYFGRKGILTLCSKQQPLATVIRDGETAQILCSELVPGDIILLKKGDLVPADCRLIHSNALHCDEQSLECGHGQIEKAFDAAEIPDIAPIEQRKNMLYMGCAILDGVATAVVTDTSDSTELGKKLQGKDLADINSLSVLGKLLNQRRITILIETALCTLLVLSGIIKGAILQDSFWGNLLYWFTLAACLIAAFLPTNSNPIGYILCYLKLRRLNKNKIIINRLDTLDKLYHASVICCDKTGSITKSADMEVMQVYDGNNLYDINELNESASRVLHIAALCCDGKIELVDGTEKRIGDSTQTAIISTALKQLNLTEEDLAVTYPRMAEIPFDRERKTMCTVNMIGGNNFAIVRGAPDKILPMCNHVNIDTVVGVTTAMASRALRVIAVAIKPLKDVPANPTNAELECNLQFVGLLGLYNPPRKDVSTTVEACRRNGIKTIMLTGDDPENALAYAQSLGILTDNTEVIDESTLSGLSDEQLSQTIDRYTVFAGVSSENKTRVVKALQSAGHTVLMTGDAIEDIEALRAADVGCTPAALGTDIAKHVSDLVTNGGLSAIASAVFNTRHLYNSIRLVFTLLCSFGISVSLIALLSIFIGNVPTFTQVLLCGVLSILLMPLSFALPKAIKTQKSNFSKIVFCVFVSLAVIISVIAGFLPIANAAMLTPYVLLLIYLLFTQFIDRNI